MKFRVVTATAVVALVPLSATAQSASKPAEDWAWRLGINLWLPGIDATTRYDLPAGGGGITAETDPSGYLSKLKFTFMGTLEAQRGPWTLLGDVVYLDVGDLKTTVTSISGPGGNAVPVDTGSRSDLKGFVGTFAGGYALMQSPGARVDAIAGVRYTKLKAKLSWEFTGPVGGLDRTGGVEQSKDFVDGVVGIRGRNDLGGNWDVRYYLDAGTGTSQLTWQALVGVGYRFNWGDAVLSYRHLAYDLTNERPISDIKFSGPQFVVGFTF